MDVFFAGTDKPEDRLVLQRWASLRIYGDADRLASSATCMAVIEDSKILSVISYHNYNPHYGVIEYSGAGDTARWLSSDVLHRMFAYPFEVVGCQMVVTRNSEHNTRLHRQLKATGHQPHRIERLRGPDEAEIVWTLTREAWSSNRIFKRAKRSFENGQ